MKHGNNICIYLNIQFHQFWAAHYAIWQLSYGIVGYLRGERERDKVAIFVAKKSTA